jgi:hypothetical protein
MPEVPTLVNVDSPEYQSRIKTSLLDLAQDISKAAGNGIPVSQTQLSSYLDLLQSLIPFPKETAKRTLSDEVREWVLATDGIFLSTDVVKELKLSTRVDIKNVSTILIRMAKENLVTRTGNKRGQYRVIDPSMAPMDWESCDVAKTYDFKLPLGLHKLMYLYPKNIIVIAGDTNAGKTAYLLNAVRENADTHEIDYFTNDLTPEELKKRVQRFTEAGMNTDNFSKCRFIPRVKDFLDVLHPDRVTIIDYLQLTDKFWLVAEDLDKIYNKLGKGICIVAIQKKTGVKLGRGGDFAMERPRLYFTLERGKLIVKKMKNLVDAEKDPNEKYVKFNLWGGCKFIPKGGWQGGAKEESRQPGGDDDLPF